MMYFGHTQCTAAVMEEYLVNTVVGLPCQSKRVFVSSTQHNLANRLTILSSAYSIRQVQRIPLDHALPT